MKYGKRLLAVMMVLVMMLTIVPLTMFAFALDGNGTSAEPYQIKTYAELKALLEGLGGDGYPADAYYRLENDIDPLHDWVFASAANQKKAAEDLGMSPIVTPATYKPAVQADIDDTSIQLYEPDGTDFIAYTGERPTAPDGYYVVNTPASSTDAPLTEEQFAAITSAQRKTILQNNSDVIPSITPRNAQFLGTFDGNNKTIKGLKIHTNATEASMFLNVGVKRGEEDNIINIGTIKDLTIDDTSEIGLVSADNSLGVSAGSVAGINAGIIRNVTSNATINVMTKAGSLLYFAYVGGIAGRNGSSEKGAEISDCTFGGTINYIVADATFSGTPNLSYVDSSSISIGGIAGGSETAITGTFSGTINTNFVGGINEEINKIYAGDIFFPGDKTEGNDLTPNLDASVKRVSSVDAATWFDSEGGEITKGALDDSGYQLIKQTKDGKNNYYIRQLVCAHNNATYVDPVPSTCKDQGNVGYWTCPDCEKKFLINPRGNTEAESCNDRDTKAPLSKTHPDAEHKDAVAATCKAKGNIEHWYCPVCEKYFLEDPTATENVTAYSQSKVQTPIDKNAHSPGEWEPYQAATTTSNATEKQVCTLCGKIVATREVPGTIVPDVVPKSGNGYSKDSTGKYLITALPTSKSGISVSQFKNSLVTGTYVVRDENGSEVTSGVVKTGYTVEVSGYPETKITIAVKGDPNKDGKISALDYVKVKNHILKKIDLSKDKAAFYAANANGDSKVSALDYVKIKNLILKG